MTKEALIAAGVNYAEGVVRFMNDSEMYETVLRIFPEDPSYPNMEAALAEGDLTRAFECAHALKGVSGNLSLVGLYRAATVLTDDLRGEKPTCPPADLEAVRRAYREIVAVIQA